MTYRERLEAIIEDAIALLDQIDGDSDFEPDPLECELGGISIEIAGRTVDDLELDHAESEPWLGWIDRLNQAGPHHGLMADLDFEGCSREWEPDHAA